MLREFRHTLFLVLQIGVILSAALALLVEPQAWRAICICAAGAFITSLVCERLARRFFHRTLGRLRRIADDIGHGRTTSTIEVSQGDDFYKLASAINLMGTRLAEASAEEKRLHEELRRRERLAFLGELAATVAHEVNNPLDGSLNCSRILRRSLGDPERARQMLDLIDNGLGRIHLIVRRLLMLAREDAIRPVEMRVRDVLESALEAVQPQLAVGDIRVQREYLIEHVGAELDPQLMEQVFVNLLLNAADAIGDRGTITLTVTCDRGPTSAKPGDRVVVAVADSGSGIPEEVLPHIFEPFFTTKAGGKGTGLGLAIAARIVDAHDGAIEVEPGAAGGTVFRVRLPRKLEAHRPRPTPAGEHRLASSAGHGTSYKG